MVYDELKNIQLTVSDIRESIIRNLEARFRKAGIMNYKAIVTDLTKTPKKMPRGKFDLLIADVPCSGSGTWARTPEQLYFSTPNKIDYYSRIQHTILENALPFLKPHGYLLYITCSVFKKENEAVVQHLQTRGLKVVKQKLFAGYNMKADTLFAALLTNS